jgi:hypothetical protein
MKRIDALNPETSPKTKKPVEGTNHNLWPQIKQEVPAVAVEEPQPRNWSDNCSTVAYSLVSFIYRER